jgi:hypothetical protein
MLRKQSEFHCISWKHAFLHLKLLWRNRKEPETGFMVEAAFRPNLFSGIRKDTVLTINQTA